MPVSANSQPVADDAASDASATNPAGEYILGVGDKLRITVFGEPEMSGEFEISSAGSVALPLVSSIPATGKTVGAVQRDITNVLAGGYLRDPRVSVEVLGYRPFFILGEVAKPGSYPYVNGMTVINAVAVAGGYTYRADEDDITLQRGGKGAKEVPIGETDEVLPGDVLRVPEKFF